VSIPKDEKKKLPENIVHEMKLWREGFAGFPESYIGWHKQLAVDRLALLRMFYGLDVHKIEVVRDGWADGMQIIRAHLCTCKGANLVLDWHDGNQGFMVRSKNAGSSILRERHLIEEVTA
jgi:hypothetical protein